MRLISITISAILVLFVAIPLKAAKSPIYEKDTSELKFSSSKSTINLDLLDWPFQSSELGLLSTKTYTYSNQDFANPERGFYTPTATSASGYGLLDSATLAGYRNLNTPYAANYSVYSTLVFRYFVLNTFKNAPISNTFLQNMIADLNTTRKAGVKLIIRFAYTVTPPTGSCGSWICPPFGDTDKARILQHIAQLKPLLQDHKDIIAAVQMGFIGVWGEQYYTDFFGNPYQTLQPNNWNDRKEVLDSLLSAVPKDINVQVRYVQQKQIFAYGNSAPTNSPALTLAEAFQGTKKSRIGFHNDCFLADSDDYGTYANYSIGLSDTTNLKPYKAQDSKFVMVGGETCDSTGVRSLCDAFGGDVIEDLKRLHYTYLNSDYNNPKVNNRWTTGGCMNEVKLKLGYRLFLTSGTYTDMVGQNGTFDYSIQMTNEGFASPVNKRNVQLVFVNQANNAVWQTNLDHDPRYWFSGNHTVSGSVCLPPCMIAGSYKVYLKLADPSPRLEDRPEYCIRLANNSMWIPSNGRNDLNHTLTITTASSTCSAPLKLNALNKWIGPNNGNWNSSTSNWSQNRIPNACDEVHIGFGKNVTVPNNYTAFALKVVVDPGGNLLVNPGAILDVSN
jgi:hypothetical protein